MLNRDQNDSLSVLEQMPWVIHGQNIELRSLFQSPLCSRKLCLNSFSSDK